MLDLLFPRVCLFCEKRSSDRYLCPSCWRLSAPPEPAGRCLHCFIPLTADAKRPADLCAQCARSPILPFPRAYGVDQGAPLEALRSQTSEIAQAAAGWLVWQFNQLDWPVPDALIAVPSRLFARSIDPVAVHVARLLARPLFRPFYRDYVGWLRPVLRLSRRPLLPTDLSLLLIDEGSDAPWLHSACTALFEAFPQEGRILSLFFPR